MGASFYLQGLRKAEHVLKKERSHDRTCDTFWTRLYERGSKFWFSPWPMTVKSVELARRSYTRALITANLWLTCLLLALVLPAKSPP